jgi:hypothetical protein
VRPSPGLGRARERSASLRTTWGTATSEATEWLLRQDSNFWLRLRERTAVEENPVDTSCVDVRSAVSSRRVRWASDSVRLLAAPAAPASRPGAILELLLVTAFVLWIAGRAVRRMQISYGSDTYVTPLAGQ